MSFDKTGKPARVGERPSRASGGLNFKPQRDDPDQFVGLLNEEEKDELRKKARETVLAEQKERASKAFYADYIDELRAADDPKLQKLPITLQLAPVGGPKAAAPYIMLDGVQYFTDTTYNVPANVAAVLIEQMNRGWAHEWLNEIREEGSRRRWTPPTGVGFGNYIDQRNPSQLRFSSAQMQGVIDGVRSQLGMDR